MQYYFEIAPHGYYGNSSMRRIIDYVISDKKTKRLLPFVGSPNVELDKAFEQMMLVKEYYNKTGGRMIRHFWVSFPKQLCYTFVDCYYIGWRISEYYASYYQIIFGVHEDTENIHIHFAMNTVRFIDGKKYSDGYLDYFCLSKHIDDVVKTHNNSNFYS